MDSLQPSSHHARAYIASMLIFILASIILLVPILFPHREKKVLYDEQLVILNRVPGYSTPSMYIDDKIQTSLYNCNFSKTPVSVTSRGAYKSESQPPIVVSYDPVSNIRKPGCETTMHISTVSAAERGLSPGLWHIEGTRTVTNGKEFVEFISETFIVLAR